jgi:hypothetical protein
MWLWKRQDFFSFDFSLDAGARVEEFVAFEDEQQFAPEALRLASVARERVLKYRNVIRTCEDAATRLAERSLAPWDYYNSAVAYGCAGETEKARRMLDRLSQHRSGFQPELDWVSNLLLEGCELAIMLTDLKEFRRRIEEIIQMTRQELKLPELTDSGLC